MTNEMAAALAFCRVLQAGFFDAAEGVDAGKIAELESAQGMAVGPDHRALLEALGRSVGRLAIGDFDITPDTLIRAHKATRGPLPAGFELIGRGTDEPFEDLFLVDRGYRQPVLESLNTRFGCDYANLVEDEPAITAGSCAEWVARIAFRQSLPGFALSGIYFRHFSDDPPPLAAVARLCQRLALNALDFSDEITYAAMSGGLVLMGTWLPQSGLSVILAAVEPGAAEAFGAADKAVVEDLGVSREPVRNQRA